MDTLADLVFQSCQCSSGRRICQRGVVDTMVRSRRPALDRMVRHRLAAILGPTTAYVVLTLVAVAVLDWVGIGRSPLWFGGWAVAMHLWFVPVYLALLTLTPSRWRHTGDGAAGAGRPGACSCGRRRCGACLASADNRLSQLPTVLGSDLSGRDLLARWGIGRPPAGANRRRGRHRARDAARASLLPDQHGRIARRARANSFPPTAALLAFATVQAALMVAASPAVTRRLRRSRWQRPLAAANKNVMAVYLWQMVRRGRRSCRVPDRALTAARGRNGTVVGLSVGLAADSDCRDDHANGAGVVGAIGVQSSAAAIPTPLPMWSAPALLIVGVGTATFVWRAWRSRGSPQTGAFRLCARCSTLAQSG